MPNGRTLRIGFDGRAFGSPAAGIRRYSAELVRAIVDLGEPLAMVALGGDAASLPSGVQHEPAVGHPPTNAGWTLVGLPRTAARARVDLIHAPAYTAPFWASVPVVLTIHDVSYEVHPEWYPYRRDRLRRYFYRRSASVAARILTVSEFSAGEIARAYGIERSRISVTPLGVHRLFTPTPADAGALPTGVEPPFVLHVGDVHERRNLDMLTEAVLAARRLGGATARLTLLLAGVDRGLGDRIRAACRTAGAADAVRFLGVVGDIRLHALYRFATALVYPSRYEGFGLPLIEAMACGTPVLAARAASIPEVVDDGGLLIDPNDTTAWRDAMVQVIMDEGLRGELAERGRKRAAAFTWRRTARLTVDVYREVLGVA